MGLEKHCLRDQHIYPLHRAWARAPVDRCRPIRRRARQGYQRPIRHGDGGVNIHLTIQRAPPGRRRGSVCGHHGRLLRHRHGQNHHRPSQERLDPASRGPSCLIDAQNARHLSASLCQKSPPTQRVLQARVTSGAQNSVQSPLLHSGRRCIANFRFLKNTAI